MLFIHICGSQGVPAIAYKSDDEEMSRKAHKLYRDLVLEKRSGSRKKNVPTALRMLPELHILHTAEHPKGPSIGDFADP